MGLMPRVRTIPQTQPAMSLLEPGPHALASLVTPDPGAIVSRKVLAEAGGRVVCFAFGEGEGLTEHTTPFEAMLVIVEGSARVGIGGGSWEVGAGELIALPAGIPHSVHALSPVRLVLVMIKA